MSIFFRICPTDSHTCVNRACLCDPQTGICPIEALKEAQTSEENASTTSEPFYCYGNAQVSGKAWVSKARVCGNGQMRDDGFVISGAVSGGRHCGY